MPEGVGGNTTHHKEHDMAYKNAQTNRQADRLHEQIRPGEIDTFHRLDRSQYDTPGSIKQCACVSCNEARRIHSVREKTWQGLARTKHEPDRHEGPGQP
jgi:hypothetical protein